VKIHPGESIREGRVQMMATIRQERFHKLRNYLRAFGEPGIDVADYDEAARMPNLCRARGIPGSAIDFLICAVAQRWDWHIFTTDRDLNASMARCWS
jgi:predicted nucleic acid-binding protein